MLRNHITLYVFDSQKSTKSFVKESVTTGTVIYCIVLFPSVAECRYMRTNNIQHQPKHLNNLWNKYIKLISSIIAQSLQQTSNGKCINTGQKRSSR